MTTATAAPNRRAAVPADRDFLLDLYASVRAPDLDLLPWNEAERAAFVRMQYDAQDTYYRRQHPHGRFDVVEVAGRPVGRLYVDHGAADVRIVDIALRPDARGGGIGTALLREVLAEAAASARTVSLHVEQHNAARRLYDRLGFVPVAERGLHLLMEWRAR